MSESRKITQEEQNCIASCITKYWGDPEKRVEAEDRDNEYEKCLNDCRICN